MDKASNGSGKTSNRKPKSAPSQLPVLVSGGAGFIGAHLCARLLREGRRVICVDNFCTSEESAIGHLISNPNFRLLRRDVTSIGEREISDVGAIFNLACAASPAHYQRKPLDTLFTSVHGMHNLLSLARRCGARVFQASTSEVYGHPSIHPQREDYWGHVNPIGPRACYDEGKRCAETLCVIYQQEYDVAVRIARIFNTYGPGMRLSDGRVVINFIVQALAGEPLTVYGEGRQTRSFCYVDDLLDGVMRMMEAGNDLAGPINLGNPAEIEIGELAQRVIRLTGSRSKIVKRPLPVDDPPRRRPDIALAMQALGWEPKTDLDTGLTLTIQDVEKRLQRCDPSLVQSVPGLRSPQKAAVAAASAS